ncbi:MAG TPA: DegQ family serine endoprotease [Dissulfurispiraceae bacterium]|nr:DegQ family serine endoprotease [Dissulfurispiraceae bacterium]
MQKNFWARIIIASMMLIVIGMFVGSRMGRIGPLSAPGGFIGFPQSFADVAARVTPAVVNISTTSTVRIPGNPFRHFFGPDDEGPFGDFFKRFYGDTPDREMKQQSLGSGFIVDKEGYILTNNHVVEGADEIKVKCSDGREFKAKVIGRDKKTDLALIKIASLFRDLPTLALGDSDTMRVGDWVLAIGNPFGLEHTVTQGIISATGRVIGAGPYDNFLQTDAPINPGNSGGPLVNLRGEVIGINTAIVSSGQGIGFAIPSSIAKTIISQLKNKGKVVRGWIGVSIQNITSDMVKPLGLKGTDGALVGDVVPGGPADVAGIKRGDVITSFNGKSIKNMSDLSRDVADMPAGRTVDAGIIRDGKVIDVKIAVTEMNEEKQALGRSAPEGNLGIRVDDITPRWRAELGLRDKTGALVTSVASGSLADEAGLQAGDIIKELNHKTINSARDFYDALNKTEHETSLLLLIKRSGQTFYVSIRMP